MKKKILVMAMVLAMIFGASACGQRSEGALMFDVPAGFVYNSEVRRYLGPNYPDELANINYYSYENDGTFGILTKETIEMTLEESLSESFLEDTDITLTAWEKTKVDGYKAFIYYIDSPYTDEFYRCAKNMRFE